MRPYLKYIKAFKMQDGTSPNFTLGKNYDIDCAFMEEEEVLVVSAIDDTNMVHIFGTNEEWFSESFTLVGDVDLVMEQI